MDFSKKKRQAKDSSTPWARGPLASRFAAMKIFFFEKKNFRKKMNFFQRFFSEAIFSEV
jgi:hypothetical protein